MKIKEIATKYKLTESDFWNLQRGGKDIWIITHDACEKIAYQENIKFETPTVFRDDNKNVAMLGGAKMGETTTWTTGEVSPNNCKAPYPFAMAEKRLKDRLTLKLINAYEYGIFSDSEADTFKK
jgi:hypothetical protein|tara:strand:+ start:1153 stop:1524 length:372 start_codon:yes stop_codon:yes gene_type:complete